MNIWDNPSNYAKCRKKLYNIAACMPPAGTVVINILEQADVVKMLGGRTYFTADEVVKMKSQNSPMFQTLSQLASQGRIYTVSEVKNVVLAGTMGEMWVVDFNKLISSYTTVTGDTIKPEDLKTWHSVRTKPDTSSAFACFVPSNIQGQISTSWGTLLNINGIGVSHGKGDFVIAQDVNGQPNLNKRYVVNGVVFSRTYNNQGFSKYLFNDKYYDTDISKLPKIWGSYGKKREEDYLISLLRELDGSKEAYEALIFMAKHINIGLSQNSILDRLKVVLNIFKSIKVKYPSLKLSYQRTIDGAKCGDYRICVDYAISINKGYYGYLFFTEDGIELITWCSTNPDADPYETIASYQNFSQDVFLSHLSKV